MRKKPQGSIDGIIKHSKAISKSAKVHRKPPQSFTRVIELLLESIITFVPPSEDKASGKVGWEGRKKSSLYGKECNSASIALVTAAQSWVVGYFTTFLVVFLFSLRKFTKGKGSRGKKDTRCGLEEKSRRVIKFVIEQQIAGALPHERSLLQKIHMQLGEKYILGVDIEMQKMEILSMNDLDEALHNFINKDDRMA
ncbi:hypothetical protein Tco_0472290 [Tanacetum coccineum]